MKKRILLAIACTGLIGSLHAQDISKHALGLRLGDSDGFGAEVSYQRKLKENNRLELDLGWRSSDDVGAVKLSGIYQWVWEIDNGFNWYAGVGGGVGTWSYDRKGVSDSGTILFAAGDVGIEYNFDIPLQLSLDLRPELYFNSDKYRTNNFGPDIALGIRYKFD
jgi:hypothetical protein